MASLWKRVKVVVVGFGLGIGLNMVCAIPIVTNSMVAAHAPNPFTALLVLFGPAGGPFAEPLALAEFSLLRMCLWGGVLLPLIALHPCWPRGETGVVSGLTI